jgi:hypothetical protein
MAPFVVFGFVSQLFLVAFFAAHLWRPADEGRLGRLVYGMGIVALVLGAAYLAEGQAWNLVLAFALYAAWSALGVLIDVIRPIEWREPPRLSILVPYATLLTLALLAFWVPLWWVHPLLWIAFAVLYVLHTALNLFSHRAARSPI